MELEVDNIFLLMMMGAAAFLALEFVDEELANKNKRILPVRSKWVKNWVMRRSKQGCYANLFKELKNEDRNGFINFVRMSPEDFDYLLNLVAPLITKKDTNIRKAIPAGEKLALTLRFLATGDSFTVPATEQAWRTVAQGFDDQWQLMGNML